MGNTPSGISTLAQDFEVFANLGPQSASQGQDPRLAQLDLAMAQAGLGTGGGDVSAQWSLPGWVKDIGKTAKDVYNVGKGLGLFSEGPDAQIEAQFLDAFLKNQVESLIKKLHEYVNRYGNLVDCVPLVTKCVQQFAAGQYGSALSTGYQAYSCINAKL